MPTPLKLLVADLDGTLLNAHGYCHPDTIAMLRKLQAMGVCVAIATGRSPYSARQVLAADFSIHYLIFSSGAGAIDWQTGKLLYATHIASTQAEVLAQLLRQQGVDFMAHDLIPDNHRFRYSATAHPVADFERRLSRYAPYARALQPNEPLGDVTQFVGIIDCDTARFAHIEAQVQDATVVRSTSPLDGHSMWMELFAPGVSKGYGERWLCQHLGGLQPHEVVVLGNDYNDIDMLRLTPNAYLVADAPEALRSQFATLPATAEQGLAQAIIHLFD